MELIGGMHYKFDIRGQPTTETVIYIVLINILQLCLLAHNLFLREVFRAR